MENLIIIGSGPAAHTAAIYAARSNLKPLMFEGLLAGGVAAGGQLTTTTEVENFPGFVGISGPELMEKMRQQSLHCGARIITETVDKVELSQRPFSDELPLTPTTPPSPSLLKRGLGGVKSDGKGEFNFKVFAGSQQYEAKVLIIASGATAKRMNLPGEDRLWQKGISACAVCDGALPIFRNKVLAVVGGGDSAVEEATYLTKFASQVLMLVRRDVLRASKVMQERAQHHPKIQIMFNTLPIEVLGEKSITGLKIRNTLKPSESTLSIGGLFYAIGHTPNTAFLNGQVELDEAGYIKTKLGTTQTSVPGVFAAGDVQDKVYRQAVTSAGTGCMAALDAERYLSHDEC